MRSALYYLDLDPMQSSDIDVEVYAWTNSGNPPTGEQGKKETLKRLTEIADMFDVISGAGKALHRAVWIFIVLACFVIFVIQVCVLRNRSYFDS